jgi:hypothetical protein
MMAMVIRLLVGLVGLLSLGVALRLWFGTFEAAQTLGLTAHGPVGLATVRADIGGLFLGMGITAMVAALRQSASWITATLVFAACALAGRVIGLIIDGSVPGSWPPILVEVIGIALFAYARSRWSKTG